MKPPPRRRCSWAIWDTKTGRVLRCGRSRAYRDQPIPDGCKLWVSRRQGIVVDDVFNVATGQPVRIEAAP